MQSVEGWESGITPRYLYVRYSKARRSKVKICSIRFLTQKTANIALYFPITLQNLCWSSPNRELATVSYRQEPVLPYLIRPEIYFYPGKVKFFTIFSSISSCIYFNLPAAGRKLLSGFSGIENRDKRSNWNKFASFQQLKNLIGCENILTRFLVAFQEKYRNNFFVLGKR